MIKEVIYNVSIDNLENLGFTSVQESNQLTITSDINIKSEVFYRVLENTIQIFDVKKYDELKKSLNKNDKNIKYFLSNYVFPTGETGLIGVKRFIPNSIYNFDLNSGTINRKTNFKFGSILKENKEFDLHFMDSINHNLSKNDNVGVLFSGGVDSILIVFSLLKLGFKPKLITMKPLIPFYSSQEDVERSIYFAKKYNLEHHIINVKINESNNINTWESTRKIMPMASHMSIYFEAGLKEASRLKINKIYTGQNADTFYNFGPTSKISFSISALADLFRRFYLVLLFEKKEYSLFKKILLNLGAKIYSLLIGDKFRAPINDYESFIAYTNSTDYSIFPRVKLSKDTNPENFDLIKSLANYKVENFLTSGAPMVINTFGLKYGIKCLFPFSSKIMLDQFCSLERGYKDIIKPKYLIYKSIESYDADILSELDKISNSVMIKKNYHNWLRENYPSFVSSTKNLYATSKEFMYNLSDLWIK